jgi:hypothetical protein
MTSHTNNNSVKIWWDTSVQAYRLVTPYNANFVELLKQLIPASDRLWDPQSKTWTVTERILAPTRQLVERIFKSPAAFISREQAERAAASQPSAAAPIGKLSARDEVLLAFVRLLPYDAARRAYREAAQALHPDHGGSMESMTQLNMLWTRLENEFYQKG